MGTNYGHIPVDPMMLSHAAISNGHTIREFYENPRWGALGHGHGDLRSVAGHPLVLLLPWLTEIGMEAQYMDWMPRWPRPADIRSSQVEELRVPSKEEL